MIIEYPKIENLFARDADNRLTDVYRCPEFEMINRWECTEKIDGTNVRVYWSGVEGEGVKFYARKSLAERDLYKDLRALLMSLFSNESMQEKFGDQETTMFGEGYGAGIQSGGHYSSTKEFALFDIYKHGKNQWLFPDAICAIADMFGIKSAPKMPAVLLSDIITLVTAQCTSLISSDFRPAEGVICKAPGLFNWKGERMIFKLKTADFRR